MTSSPASRLALSAVQGQVAKVLQSVLGLLTGLVMARALGPAGVGVYASALALAVLVQMATSFGLEDLIVNRVPGLVAAGRREQARSLVYAVAVIRAIVAFALIVVAVLVAISGWGGASLGSLSRVIIALAVIYAALNSIATLGAAIKAANSEALKPALLDTGWSALMLAGVSAMAFLGKLSAFRVIALAAATESAVVIGYYILVGREVDRTSGRSQIPRKAAATFWGNALLAFGFGKSTDLLLIRLSGLPFGAVGIYSAAFSAFTLSSILLVAAIGTFLQVALVGAIGQRDQARVERVWRRAVTLVALASLPTFALMALESRLVIRTLYGDAFVGAALPLVILAISGMIIRAVGGGSSQAVLYAKDRQGVSLRIRIVSVVLNIIGDIVFVRIWGIAGVAVATGTCGLLAILLEYRCARHLLRLPHPTQNVVLIACGTAVASIVTYSAPVWPQSNIFTLAIHGTVFVATFYCCELFLKPIADDYELVTSLPAPVRVVLSPLSRSPHAIKSIDV